MANIVNFSTYGFLDDILALNEDNWRRFFKPIIYDSVQSGLEVSAGTGTTVIVSAGECRCGSIMGISNSQMLLDIDVGSGEYNRIDSVVVQYIYGDPSTLSVAVIKGTPSASPVPPTLVKTYNSLWQMEIAQILVPVNATTASECTFTDKRVVYNSLDSLIEPISENIANINDEMFAITSNIEDINTVMASITTDIENINDEIASITSDIADINNEIFSITSSLESITTNIENINTEILSITTEINSITTDIDNINTEIDSITTNINAEILSITTNISNINTEIDSITTNIDDINTEIDSITTDIDSVSTKINDKILYFSVPVATGQSVQIMQVPNTGTDSRITPNTVVLECSFENPNYITSDIQWSSDVAGVVTFVGTCTAVTNANITLGTKGN